MACNEDEYRSKARARAQKNRCYRAPTGRARQAPTRLSNSAVFGCSCAIEHDVSVWPNAADNPAISTYQLRNCYIPIVMLRASARQPRAPDGVWPPYRSLWAATPPFSNSTARSQRSRESNASKSGRERAIERSRAAAPQLLPPRIRGEDPARAFRIAPPREPPLPEAGPLSRSPAGTV
jgi:hypothetical protein